MTVAWRINNPITEHILNLNGAILAYFNNLSRRVVNAEFNNLLATDEL